MPRLNAKYNNFFKRGKKYAHFWQSAGVAPSSGTIIRPLTISSSLVSGTHSDFTVYFFGTYAELKTIANGGLVANANGYDIGFFSDSACTAPLKWETVLYNASTGKYFFKIKIPIGVSSSADKVFYIRYGDASITTDQSDKVNAYDATTKLVMGLGDGTTLSINDSTASPITAVNNGATATSGFINGAASLVAGSSQYIELTDPTKLQITGQIEFSFWINFNSLSGLQNIIAKFYTGTENYFRVNGGSIEVGSYNGSDHNTSYGSLTTGVDYFIQGYYDGSNWKIDVNGVNVASTADATGALSTTDQWALGAGRYGAWGRFLDAKIAELKISSASRTTGWHLTEYNSMVSQSSFITIGAPISGGGGGSTIQAKAFEIIYNYQIATIKGKGLIKATEKVVDITSAIAKGKGRATITEQIQNIRVALAKGKANGKANDRIEVYQIAKVNGKGKAKAAEVINNYNTATIKGKSSVKVTDYIENIGRVIVGGGLTIKVREYAQNYASATIKGKGRVKAFDSTFVVNSATIKGKSGVHASIAIDVTSTANIKGKARSKAMDELVTSSIAKLQGKGYLKAIETIDITVTADIRMVTIYGAVMQRYNNTTHAWELYRLKIFNGKDVTNMVKRIWDPVSGTWKVIQEA